MLLDDLYTKSICLKWPAQGCSVDNCDKSLQVSGCKAGRFVMGSGELIGKGLGSDRQDSEGYKL